MYVTSMVEINLVFSLHGFLQTFYKEHYLSFQQDYEKISNWINLTITTIFSILWYREEVKPPGEMIVCKTYGCTYLRSFESRNFIDPDHKNVVLLIFSPRKC